MVGFSKPPYGRRYVAPTRCSQLSSSALSTVPLTAPLQVIAIGSPRNVPLEPRPPGRIRHAAVFHNLPCCMVTSMIIFIREYSVQSGVVQVLNGYLALPWPCFFSNLRPESIISLQTSPIRNSEKKSVINVIVTNKKQKKKNYTLTW